MHKSPSIRFLNAGAHQAPAGQDFPPHRHTCWELLYYREGRIELVIGDRAYPTEPGAILATPPRTTHAERALTRYANYYVTLEAPPDCPWPVCCYDDADQNLRRLFAAMVAESHSLHPDRDAMLAALACELDLHLRRAASRPHPPGDVPAQVVRRAEVLFQNRLSEPLAIAAVAAELQVALSTLRAYFVNVRGHPPQEALLRFRLDHARALLRNSNLTLEAVAELCGFYSASHLSRHYKKRHGHSPGRQRGG